MQLFQTHSELNKLCQFYQNMGEQLLIFAAHTMGYRWTMAIFSVALSPIYGDEVYCSVAQFDDEPFVSLTDTNNRQMDNRRTLQYSTYVPVRSSYMRIPRDQKSTALCNSNHS